MICRPLNGCLADDVGDAVEEYGCPTAVCTEAEDCVKQAGRCSISIDRLLSV